MHRRARSVGSRLTTVLAVFGLMAIGGCAHHPHAGHGGHGGGYYQNDGPPDDDDIDISKIPDAVPKNEPPSKYGNPSSYTALGQRYYVLKSAAGFTQTGRASWYGRQFHGARTSSGEPYNMFSMTAAHKRLPIPSWVRVTNLENGRHVIVKVNDRGPFHDGRIIDLSYVAARKLGIVANGSAPVRIRTVTPADYRQNPATPDPTREPEAPLRAAINPPASDASPPASPSPSRAATPRPPTAPQRAPYAPRPSSPPQAPAEESDDEQGEMLQVGAFAAHANALELRQRLTEDGLGPVVILPPSPQLALYRVRLGPFVSLGRRDAVARRLVADGYVVRSVKR